MIYSESNIDTSALKPYTSGVKLIRLDLEYPWIKKKGLDTEITNIEKRSYKRVTFQRRFAQSKGLFYKSLSMYHAVQNNPHGTLVVWLDADTVVHRQPDPHFANFLKHFDVVSIPHFRTEECRDAYGKSPLLMSLKTQFECMPCPDTGILAYRVSDDTRDMVKKHIQWYRQDATKFAKSCDKIMRAISKKQYSEKCYKCSETSTPCSKPCAEATLCSEPYGNGNPCSPLSSMNDMGTTKHTLFMSRKKTKQGYFAITCVPTDDFATWSTLALKFYPPSRKVGKGAISFCPSDNQNVSPFNVLEYILHAPNFKTGLADKRHKAEEKTTV